MKFEKWIKDWKTSVAENFFLKILVLVLGITIIVTLVSMQGRDKIILVPPNLDKEAWLLQNKASPEYLQTMALFYVTFLANLTPQNAEYNMNLLLKRMPPRAQAQWQSELQAQAENIVKNNVRQAFYVNFAEIFPEENAAEVIGTLERYIGNVSASSDTVRYRIGFTVSDYQPFITELTVTTVDSKTFKPVKLQKGGKK